MEEALALVSRPVFVPIPRWRFSDAELSVEDADRDSGLLPDVAPATK
jgi:hypothetical protein